MSDLKDRLEALNPLHISEKLQQMNQLLESAESPSSGTEAHVLYAGLVDEIFSDTTLSSQRKVSFGELVNKWGDPRIVDPSDQRYWVTMQVSQYRLNVARHMVTIKEWVQFLNSGYGDEANWSAQGMEWKSKDRPSWNDLASASDSQKYLFDNQPVVGVCWFEAEAYANANKSRLMSFYERELIVRGVEKRPYPWGSPFGHGNANTQEEGLEKPCAVGLYSLDSTPEGIFDLAGNVAEWTDDDLDSRRVIHPGSWKVDSMGAWVKASSLYSAAARTAFLGFRLVRDI